MSDFETTPSSEADLPDGPSAASPESTDPHDVDPGPVSADDAGATEDTATEDTPAEEKIEGIPEGEELEEIASDLDDIESVLKNLDKDNADFDAACAAAEAEGTISERPALDAYWQAKSKAG